MKAISINSTPVHKGDVIFAKRTLYSHYGIYTGHNKVIHFRHEDSPGHKKASIEQTSFLTFSKGDPVYICQFLEQADSFYSPHETIKRAKSRLGKTGYNVITNNCEHFALWCKTGQHESKQVENICTTVFGSRFEIDEVINKKSEKILEAACGFLDRIPDKLKISR